MSSNKVMLITGATSGIGKSLAEHFYKKKYKLILTGSSEKKNQYFKKKILFGVNFFSNMLYLRIKFLYLRSF